MRKHLPLLALTLVLLIPGALAVAILLWHESDKSPMAACLGDSPAPSSGIILVGDSICSGEEGPDAAAAREPKEPVFLISASTNIVTKHGGVYLRRDFLTIAGKVDEESLCYAASRCARVGTGNGHTLSLEPGFLFDGNVVPFPPELLPVDRLDYVNPYTGATETAVREPNQDTVRVPSVLVARTVAELAQENTPSYVSPYMVRLDGEGNPHLLTHVTGLPMRMGPPESLYSRHIAKVTPEGDSLSVCVPMGAELLTEPLIHRNPDAEKVDLSLGACPN